MPHLAEYVPILVHFVIVLGLAGLVIILHAVLGGSYPTPVKQQTYESGVWPIGSARERIPVRYYLVAMLFIIFDVEAVFLYPWAVVFRGLGVPGLVALFSFIGVLLVGYVYVWRRGALEWR